MDRETQARIRKAEKLRDGLTAAALTQLVGTLEAEAMTDRYWREAAQIIGVRDPSDKTKAVVVQMLRDRINSLVGVVQQPADPFEGLA